MWVYMAKVVWECAMDMETFLKGGRDGCDSV